MLLDISCHISINLLAHQNIMLYAMGHCLEFECVGSISLRDSSLIGINSLTLMLLATLSTQST